MSKMEAPAKGVKVRMYRGGLGDCFLLAFPGEDGQPHYVMIDCGLFMGTPNIGDTLTRRMEDIAKATENHIDVLVLTHEHYDHLSGFKNKEAFERFTQIEVGALWLAWTENPVDADAKALRGRMALTLNALEGLAARLEGTEKQTAVAGRVRGILEFAGAGSNDELRTDGPSTEGLSGMEAVVDKVRHQVGEARTRYLSPGDGPLKFKGVKDLRAYVFGPPRDGAYMGRQNPSAGVNKETYLGETGLDVAASFLAGALEDEQEGNDEQQPFESQQGHPLKTAEVNSAFFREHYANGPSKWRRIDEDWLGGTEQLALRFDSVVNNTSLVLAFELVRSGRVLLFVADAQVGNWLSWFEPTELHWTVDGRKIAASDLVERTVLYKVGHHGSHNATLKANGLERMTSPELVAMIPVDEAFAKNVKHWQMPFADMLEALEVRTRGRVMRADTGAPKEKPAALSKRDWNEFQGDLTETDLYVEFTVSD